MAGNSLSDTGGTKIVNFGCGPSPSAGVLNIDGSPTVLLARLPLPAVAFGSRKEFIAAVRQHGVRYGLGRTIAFADRSLDGFYTSHTLEHMSRGQCVSLLSKVRCWLKPSGILRVVLPDLRRFNTQYAEGEFDADKFIQSMHLAIDGMPWWKMIFGHAYHRWMYDASTFSKLLSELGYSNVRQCVYGEGKVPGLVRLDLPERRSESFYIEAEP
jgi:hypothetical protein